MLVFNTCGVINHIFSIIMMSLPVHVDNVVHVTFATLSTSAVKVSINIKSKVYNLLPASTH